jgi:hypothetical protein
MHKLVFVGSILLLVLHKTYEAFDKNRQATKLRKNETWVGQEYEMLDPPWARVPARLSPGKDKPLAGKGEGI